MGLVLVFGTGFTVLRVSFEGPSLGSKISTLLNKKMRGRIEIGSVEWDTVDLQKAVTGGWVGVRMRDVKVWDDCALNSGASAVDEIRLGDPNEDCTLDDRPDPDPTSKRRPRKLLLRTELITGEIDIHALMFGNHDFVFRNLWVFGGEALLEQTAEPYPLHAYDRTIVSIVTAFYPRMKASFRAGIYADQPPPIFDLRDIHIKDLSLTVHMNPYTLRPLVTEPGGNKPRANSAPFTRARNFSFAAPLVVVPGTGCAAIDATPELDVRGKIAIVEGGECSPKAKARNFQLAGVAGLVITGTDPELSTPPTLDDDPLVRLAITIPVLSIGRHDGDTLRSDRHVIAGTAKATLRDTIGYVTTARLEHVDVDADAEHPTNSSYLYMDSVDPLVSKLYVRLEVAAKTGVLRLWDEGLRETFRLPHPGIPTHDVPEEYPPQGREAEYEIALADIKLHRLAQLPTEWARKDYVANTLELDLETRTVPCRTDEEPRPDPTQGATLHITGELYNYWDRPYDGSWNLALDGKNMGPTIHTCIKRKISGDNLDGRITLSGPFVASPKIGLSLKNLDFNLPLRSGLEPLQLTLAEVQGSIDLVNEQGSLDRTTALIRNGKEPGEVVLSANFGLKPYNARAHVEIVKPIDLGKYLPVSMRPIGTFLKGRLTAVGDADIGFSLEDFDLALGRTQTDTAIRAHHGRLFTDDDFDTVKIQQVAVEAGRSRASIDGEVDLANEMIKKIVIDGYFPDLGVWLKRFGLPAFVESAGGGQIVITGPISKPTVNVATELGGVPCLDKVRIVDSQFDSATRVFDIRRLTSKGLGGEITGSARIKKPENGGLATIEKLHVDGKRLDASRICGVGNLMKGTVDTLDLEMAGTIDSRRAPLDWLNLAKVKARAEHLAILGDRFTNVALCLNRKDDASCRPRPGYLDGDDRAQCEQGKRTGFCAVATATRDGGGLVDATIAQLPGTRVRGVTSPPRLAGTVALSDVPVAIIDQLLNPTPTGKKAAAPAAEPRAPFPAGGLASMTLHLEGARDAPQAAGAIQLLRTWVEGTFVGDAQLVVSPSKLGTVPGIKFEGSALANRLRISGTLGTQRPYPVELKIYGRRIEAGLLFDLQKRLKLPLPTQAWVTGTVTIRHQLAPLLAKGAKKPEPEAWIELSELRGIVRHTGADGQIVPLAVTAVDQDRAKRPAVSIHVTPSSVDFACRDSQGKRFECATRLAIGPQNAAPAGNIDFRGHVTPQQVAIEAVGKLELASLAPLLETQFTCVSGTADVSASISGSYKQPSYQAALALDHIEVTPVGGDTILEAESGLVKLANGSLGFTNVKVRVRDPHRDAASTGVARAAPARASSCAGKESGTTKDEAGELFIKGNIALDGLTPVSWGLLVEGKLAGKTLVVLANNVISQATGLASIQGDLLLTGKGPRPTISGTLVFDPPPPCASSPDDPKDCRKPGELPRPITIVPRYLPREVAITGGTVEIETDTDEAGDRSYKLSVLRDLNMSIDGEGQVQVRERGYAEIRDGNIAKLGLRIDADNLTYHPQGGKFDLTLSAKNVTISRADDSSNLEVAGRLSIIDGTFEQDFEIAEGIRSLASTAAPVTPIWDASSLLGNAELNLLIDVRKFSLKSNIAAVDMSGENLALQETPRDPRLSGSIRVDRGRFKLPGMRAAFTRTNGQINFNRDEKAGNPDLKITSEADYRDLTGQDHVITLTIEGYVDSLKWDLRTSTGYNKSQTVSLLLLGRNPEQLRRSLGDQILGSNINNIDPTTNPTQGFADQIVKDLAGDWVSDLLENSLTKLTGLDVLRIEVGFGSIGFHIEKKFAENVNVIGTYEQTIRGNTINARGELKTPYKISVQGGWLRKDFNDPAEQDITDTSVKAVFHLLP